MATSVIQRPNEYICHGATTFALSGAVEMKDKDVDFGHTYQNPPTVFVQLYDYARGATSGAPKTSVGVYEARVSGATLRLKTASVTSGNVTCYWLAIGV